MLHTILSGKWILQQLRKPTNYENGRLGFNMLVHENYDFFLFYKVLQKRNALGGETTAKPSDKISKRLDFAYLNKENTL